MRLSGHVIEYLRVEGALIFPALDVQFHRGMNALVGEFGTGKSGVLHYLAYGLGLPIVLPDPEEHEEYVRDTLGPGRIRVGIRTEHGVPYEVVRAYGEAPIVYDERGIVASVSLGGELFRARIYGAGALAAMAKSAPAQRELLDGFAEAEVRHFTQEIATRERLLAENGAHRRRLAIEIEEDAARTSELATVTEALKGLGLAAAGSSQGDAALAHQRTLARGRERTAIAALTREIRAAGQSFDAFASAALRRLSSTVEADLERGVHGPLFQRAHAAVVRVAGAIEATAGKLRESLAEGEAAVGVEERALAVVHAAEEEAYRTLVIAESADKTRAAERDRLARRFEELSVAAKRLADRRRELDDRVRERDALRDERIRLVRERWKVRDRTAKELTEKLAGRIQVSVLPERDVTAYQALLAELLRGSGIREEVVRAVAGGIRPHQLVDLVAANDGAPIEQVDPLKTGRPARALKILEALRKSERLGELEVVALDDVPQIELRVGKKKFVPSGRVSLGQRCTSILPILLLLTNAPLLIDQPEDNLHNKFIFDSLVPSLIEMKALKQLIFASHNPNLVVLGSADRVFALVTEDGVGKLGAFGDLDEMREWIEGILEGGRRAFMLRWERYRREKEDAQDDDAAAEP